jgi:hypothetical protein
MVVMLLYYRFPAKETRRDRRSQKRVDILAWSWGSFGGGPLNLLRAFPALQVITNRLPQFFVVSLALLEGPKLSITVLLQANL